MKSARLLASALCCAGLLFAASSGAAAFDEQQERGEITASLTGSMQEGYNALDAERILSIYAPGATIIGYVMGTGNVETLREYIVRDLAASREVRSELHILDISFDGEEAVVSSRLAMQKIHLADDRSSVRNDPYFMKMKKIEGAWKVFLQSYRPDFGAAVLPHGGQGGPAKVSPHGPR